MMSTEKQYEIRTATSHDRDSIFRFLKRSFFPNEPVNIGMESTSGPEDPSDMYQLRSLDDGLTLIAVIPGTEERIIGVCIGGKTTQAWWKELEETKENIRCLPERKVLDLFLMANKEVNVWSDCELEDIFTVHMLTVDPEFARKHIAMDIGKRGIEMARSKGHKIIYTGCTNAYAAKIADALGFKCVYRIDFKDYLGEDGKPVFNPPSPHTEFRIYVLKL